MFDPRPRRFLRALVRIHLKAKDASSGLKDVSYQLRTYPSWMGILHGGEIGAVLLPCSSISFPSILSSVELGTRRVCYLVDQESMFFLSTSLMKMKFDRGVAPMDVLRRQR